MPQACKFVRKGTLGHVFSCEFDEISRNTFFIYRTPPGDYFCVESNAIEVAKRLIDFFSNIIKNLAIPELQYEVNLYSRLSSNPVLQAIMKYR